ncbi:MAG: HAD-IA family hydrolase [Clostridia bacterium]|nr:HAD-IA family hydrolase [Clostridia bacterium]
MIRAVIFDMYETLVTLMTGPRCFSRDMAAIAGADTERFRAAWRATEDARMLGHMTFEAAVRQAMERSGCFTEAAFGRIIDLRRASREIRPERLHGEILPMLTALHDRGVKVGLITNCQSEEAEAIRESILWPHFDVPVLSCEAGVMKPDPAIFRLCLEQLRMSPRECLYVGDGGSHELEAAQALGMRAVQAAWYLTDDPIQPVGRLTAFPAADSPLAILDQLN